MKNGYFIFREKTARDRASHRQDRPKMSDELIVIGSPFPSIENDNKDYIPVWKQKVKNKFQFLSV